MQELLNNYLPNVAQRLPDFGQALKETLVMVAWSVRRFCRRSSNGKEMFFGGNGDHHGLRQGGDG